MKSIFKLTCPYCGVKLDIAVDGLRIMQMIVCDTEVGGCDKPFIYKINYLPEIKYFKVEGL